VTGLPDYQPHLGRVCRFCRNCAFGEKGAEDLGMIRIEWDEGLSVKEEVIDFQHKKWIAMLNEVHDALFSDNGSGSYSKTMDALKAMNGYARFHFDFEEEYMREIGYPGIQEHSEQHDMFPARLKELYLALQTGQHALSKTKTLLLIDWLQEHIRNEDCKYSRFAGRNKK